MSVIYSCERCSMPCKIQPNRYTCDNNKKLFERLLEREEKNGKFVSVSIMLAAQFRCSLYT